VTDHHDACAPWVHEDMMRSVDPDKSPTCLLEFTYQVSAARLCMVHTHRGSRESIEYEQAVAGEAEVPGARPVRPMPRGEPLMNAADARGAAARMQDVGLPTAAFRASAIRRSVKLA
jgi:hypothetical protein